MIIKKYGHSCLVLEKHGKRLLIDPGMFCFLEGLSPKDIGAVDVIILTHSHPDHYYPPALKEILQLNSATIFASQQIADLLQKEQLSCKVIQPTQEVSACGFHIKAIHAPHGCMPVEVPHNNAYLIDDAVLHPGDSLEIASIQCKVLALPIAGPWLRLIDALDVAKQIRPAVVIPIHDAIIKNFMLERIYGMCTTTLGNATFRPLALGEELNV